MTKIWKRLSFVFLLGLLSSMTAAQDASVNDSVLSLSPDGTKMVVYSMGRYVMDKDGELLFELFPDHWVSTVNWSPDGTQIAVSASNDEKTSLYLVDPDTGEAKLAFEDSNYFYIHSWSPDGQWLLLVSQNQEYRVWERATNEMTPVIDGGLRLQWSPDSQFITIARRHNDIIEISLFDLQAKLLFDDLFESYVFQGSYCCDVITAWSPDSQQMAVSFSEDPTIYLIDIDRKFLKPFAYTGGRISSLNWSADGSEIYYGFAPVIARFGSGGSVDQPAGLYRVPMADGIPSLIWSGRAQIGLFAPDAKHFFVSENYGSGNGYLLGIGDITTGIVSPIKLNFMIMEQFFWSADSQQLVISICTSDEYDMDIYRVDTRTYETVMVTQDGTSENTRGCDVPTG